MKTLEEELGEVLNNTRPLSIEERLQRDVEAVDAHSPLGPDFHRDNTQMKQLPSPLMEKVERTMTAYGHAWHSTSDALRLRAKELQEAAKELTDRADYLDLCHEHIDNIKASVSFEIESRERCQSLMFVIPPKD